jgi:predicted RNA-binding protein YlxR (DUF448 family)
MAERTCIACKRKSDQVSFWRVARDLEGRVALWKGLGRSAYICKRLECVEDAMAKGRLERALRGAVAAEGKRVLREELICKLR